MNNLSFHSRSASMGAYFPCTPRLYPLFFRSLDGEKALFSAPVLESPPGEGLPTA